MRTGTMAILSAAVLAGVFGFAYAGDGKTEGKDGSCCATSSAAACEAGKTETVAMKEDSAKQQFEAIKSLAGKWEGEAKEMPSNDKLVSEFKVTAAGSVVMETMFPGSDHEMVNLYHLDGDSLIMTHYCAQGVQPRMKLAGTEGKTMKFDFLDCTNLPSKDAPHMHDMSLTIEGDSITESWGYFKDGKVEDHAKFQLTRQKQASAAAK